MKKTLSPAIQFIICLTAFAVLFAGCSQPEQTAKPAAAKPVPEEKKSVKSAAPEMTVRMASLDLSKPPFKIEQQHINQIAEVLRKENIDVLTLQGVSRYPGVTTRVDVVDALAFATGMTPVFEETVNLNGKQTGNAVFSRLPVLSHDVKKYEQIHSNIFASALQVIIDMGKSQVVVISTELPPSSQRADLMSCLGTLDSFRHFYTTNPIIVSGNLPRDETAKEFAAFTDASIPGTGNGPRFWFTGSPKLKPMTAKFEPSPVGTLTIMEWGLW